jgi:hypothetical protein
MLPKPPSSTEWLLDGLQRGGHSVAETIAFAAWHGDYDDEQATLRVMPADVILAGPVESRFVTRLRRWFGR